MTAVESLPDPEEARRQALRDYVHRQEPITAASFKRLSRDFLSKKASLQLRDGHGRFIEMGDSVIVRSKNSGASSAFSGKVEKLNDNGTVSVLVAKTGKSVDVPSRDILKITGTLGGKPDAVKQLDDTTQKLIGDTNKKLGPTTPNFGGPAAPASPAIDQGMRNMTYQEGLDKQAAPAAPVSTDRAFLAKPAEKLEVGDRFNAYTKDGTKLTLKINGLANTEGGRTATTTDEMGKQHTVPLPNGGSVMAEPPLPELTPEEFDNYVKAMQEGLDKAKAARLETHVALTLDEKNQVYSPERVRQHQQLLDDIWNTKAVQVPNEGKALFSGGLGGAGKGSTLSNPRAGIDQKAYLTLNPDDFKEEMARRGMIPEVPGGNTLAPMEKSTLIHEESGYLADMLAARAFAEKKNVIWDITMNKPDSVNKRVEELKQYGYDEMKAVFVDIPVSESVNRAMSRFKGGLERYRNGKGDGGRYVPPEIIQGSASSPGNFSSKNRAAFEETKHQFTSWQVWDNSRHKDHRPEGARLVYSSDMDPAMIERFTEESKAGLTDLDRANQGLPMLDTSFFTTVPIGAP